MRKKGETTGGMLAPNAKEFSCKVGDSLEQIQRQNPHLDADEVQRVFNVTREEKDEDYAPELATED